MRSKSEPAAALRCALLSPWSNLRLCARLIVLEATAKTDDQAQAAQMLGVSVRSLQRLQRLIDTEPEPKKQRTRR